MYPTDETKGLKLKAGQEVEFHYPDPLESAIREFPYEIRLLGSHLAMQPSRETQWFPIENCVVETASNRVHIWAPGTERNPS
jgi:hypothetical protein